MNIRQFLIKQAENNSQKKGLIFSAQATDFFQLKDISFRLSNSLLRLGLNKGDRVAIFLSNCPEAVFSFLGGFSIGAVIVPLDFMLTEEEVVHFLNHSQTKVLIAQPKKDLNLRNIKDKCPGLEAIIVCKQRVEGFLFWDYVLESSEAQEPEIEINDNDVSSIFYTSGSTGHPKGVVLTYKHLSNPSRTIDYFLKISEKDTFLCGGVPFSHIGGLVYILLMVQFGSGLVLMERFQPLEFIKNIDNHKVTIFCIVPAMYIAILSLKESDKFDLSSLRFAVVFGAPSSAVLLKRFNKICPNARLSNGWGMTETAAPNCMLEPGLDKIHSIGKFAPGMQAKIVDESEKELGFNSRGELWVKGEAVMLEYYKEPKLTKEVLTKDSWLKTGDIAYYDAEGLFYIVGRKKDMIKVAGEIVFPAEVEEKMQRYPKIKEAAVIGIADDLRGEVPKAFVVVNPGEELNEQGLKEYLKKYLAHFKIPHYFEVVNELPKNKTGKIDKQALIKTAA